VCLLAHKFSILCISTYVPLSGYAIARVCSFGCISYSQ
jgi:hypothetical protein